MYILEKVIVTCIYRL